LEEVVITMAGKKIYAGSGYDYERKLKNVMERLGIKNYNHDWGRRTAAAQVQFEYQGQWFNFEQSREKSHAHGGKLELGSDCLAQIVLTLEDLARAAERGIYNLSAFLGDELKMLPAPAQVPECFILLGFKEIPNNKEEVHERYRKLSKVLHPAGGGSDEEFRAMKEASEQAEAYFGDRT
jgi:hypothetical protein